MPENIKHNQIVDFIIERRKLIEKIFVGLFIVTAICFPFVKINYDLSKYLPPTMPSKQGINLMEKEFGYPGTARLMIDDVSIYQAKLYKDQIQNLNGVDRVVWADSSVDVYQASQFLNYDDIKDYYKDKSAIMDITFTENDSSSLTHDAINKIQSMLGEKAHMGGAAVQNKFLNEIIMKEMGQILIFSVFIILAILAISTNFWYEPIVFLVVILISIVINMGSNILFGEISSMTLSVAAVLQLAIAMDYTIILLDNFTKERKHNLPVEEALANAIKKSITPIGSAGAAAILGFLALVLMRYSIGKDMGLVLAKGIAISLVTVLFLTPAVIMRWYGVIEKSAHKQLVPSFRPFAEKIYKFRYLFLVLTLLIAIPSFIAKDMTDFTFGNDAMGLTPGTKVYEDEQEMNKKFGRNNLVLIIIPNTSMVTEKKLSTELENLNYTKYVTSLASTLPEGVPVNMIPESMVDQLHTENYARIVTSINTATESDLAFKSIAQITNIVHKYYPKDSYIIGVTPSTIDIKNVIIDDWSAIDKVSMLGVALAIMIAFRSFSLPFILMIPIEMAIFMNMAMPYILGNRIMFMGYVIVSCLQLGATIDYSIVMTHHYLIYRRKMGKVEASIKATTASALPILTSGLILAVAGYGVYYLSSVSAISDLGRLIGRGAIFSMMLVLAVLPNLFVFADKFIILRDGSLLPKPLAKLFEKKQKEEQDYVDDEDEQQ
ncbi:MAG: MMPL family transporter [Eubacteriales bacterium]